LGGTEHDEGIGIAVGEDGVDEQVTADEISGAAVATQIRHNETVIVDDGGITARLGIAGDHRGDGQATGSLVPGGLLEGIIGLLRLGARGAASSIGIVKVLLNGRVGGRIRRRGGTAAGRALDVPSETHGVKRLETHLGKCGEVVLDLVRESLRKDTGGKGGLGVSWHLVEIAALLLLTVVAVRVRELLLVILGVGPTAVIDERVDLWHKLAHTPPVLLGGFLAEALDEIGTDTQKGNPRYKDLRRARGRHDFLNKDKIFIFFFCEKNKI